MYLSGVNVITRIIDPSTLPEGARSQDKQQHILDIVMAGLEEDKAENVSVLDLAGRASFADKMVIATCLSARQMSSIAQHIDKRLKEAGFGHAIIEGDQNSDWVLMDTGDIVVNLFMAESRELYGLERMWSSDFERSGKEVVIGHDLSVSPL